MFRSRRSNQANPGPGRPHRFAARQDNRSALALGGLQPDLQQAAPLALAEASGRDSGCSMAGCGKSREDPIHSPPEEPTEGSVWRD
jgi:hypothetical protein